MAEKYSIERLEVAMATLQAELDEICARLDESGLDEKTRTLVNRLRSINVSDHFETVRAIYCEEWPAEVIEIRSLLRKT